MGTEEAALLRAWLAVEAEMLRAWSAEEMELAAYGWRQRGRRRRLVYSGDGDSGSKDVGGFWYKVATSVSGETAEMEKSAMELAASGATAAMETADGDGSRLAAA